MDGYGGFILRVDLSSETIEKEPLREELVEKYLGGQGINDYLLWEHFLKVSPLIDPRDGERNVLIAGLGPLGGTGLGLGAKMKFTFKGPCYNLFGDSVSGGTFGPMMRWAGYDHLVITGKAKRPAYIFIDDDDVQIREASHLWGKMVDETWEALREELDDEDVGIACIGPAGENLVGFASIMITHERAAGRTGAGCVMGSKNLKALCARGTKGLKAHDPGAFSALALEAREILSQGPMSDAFKKSGTLSVVEFYDAIFGHSYKNNQSCKVPKESISALSGQEFSTTIKASDAACSPGCLVGCGSFVHIKGHESPLAQRFRGMKAHAPEYFSVATFGFGCDIADYAAVTHLHNLCNHYGMDLGEIGNMVPFLMELWEKEVIGPKEAKKWTDGEDISFEWGNLEAVEKAITSVALQNNPLGRLLRDGILPAALTIEEETGQKALPYALYGKGGMAVPEEIRPFPIWAVNFAVSSRGGDHLKGISLMDKGQREDLSLKWLGQKEAGQAFTAHPAHGKASALSEMWATAINCLGVCCFKPIFNPEGFSLEFLARAYTALTGREMSEEKLLLIGRRAYNLEKAFNSRLGLRRKDDTLCERWMKEPCIDGPGKGMKAGDYLDALLDAYYQFHGWDEKTSLQRRACLEELGLEDVAEVLEREGALA